MDVAELTGDVSCSFESFRLKCLYGGALSEEESDLVEVSSAHGLQEASVALTRLLLFFKLFVVLPSNDLRVELVFDVRCVLLEELAVPND